VTATCSASSCSRQTWYGSCSSCNVKPQELKRRGCTRRLKKEVCVYSRGNGLVGEAAAGGRTRIQSPLRAFHAYLRGCKRSLKRFDL